MEPFSHQEPISTKKGNPSDPTSGRWACFRHPIALLAGYGENENEHRSHKRDKGENESENVVHLALVNIFTEKFTEQKGENRPLVFFEIAVRGRSAVASCNGCLKVVNISGQYFIFGALCPSKSGLLNEHIVNISGLCGTIFHFWCPVPV